LAILPSFDTPAAFAALSAVGQLETTERTDSSGVAGAGALMVTVDAGSDPADDSAGLSAAVSGSSADEVAHDGFHSSAALAAGASASEPAS